GDHQDIAGAEPGAHRTPDHEADRAPDTQDGGEEYQRECKSSVEEHERIDHKLSIVGLRVVVVKAVRAPVAPAFVGRVLVAAAAEPAVAAVLAGTGGAGGVTGASPGAGGMPRGEPPPFGQGPADHGVTPPGWGVAAGAA